MTFIIGTFQFRCKTEHKQVKRNKITQKMYKSESIFPHLQSSIIWVGGGVILPHSWFPLNSSEMVKAATLVF